MSHEKSRTPLLYLQDIIQACHKVMRYTAGMTREAFESDAEEMAHDAVLRNLHIIGEAVTHLPQDLVEKAPGIQWKKIAGFRIQVSHVYFGLDEDIVWDVVTAKVPELLGMARLLYAVVEPDLLFPHRPEVAPVPVARSETETSGDETGKG